MVTASKLLSSLKKKKQVQAGRHSPASLPARDPVYLVRKRRDFLESTISLSWGDILVMNIVDMSVQWLPVQQPMCPIKPSIMDVVQN